MDWCLNSRASVLGRGWELIELELWGGEVVQSSQIYTSTDELVINCYHLVYNEDGLKKLNG